MLRPVVRLDGALRLRGRQFLLPEWRHLLHVGALESPQSYARPGKLFTASGDLIVAEVGALTPDALTKCPGAGRVIILTAEGRSAARQA